MAGEALMRVSLVLTAALITAAMSDVSSQTRTADGVAALARGDYQRAVEILKPIAEDWQSRDTTAQFFMAALYETGHGVPADPLRACALYARAASNSDSPFGRQASPLFAALRSGRGLQFDHECQRLANVGFDTAFEPVAFDLGPGHFVEWTSSNASVTYQGQTKSHPIDLAQAGARFLPPQHTQLATGPTRSLPRHFVEVVFWSPGWKAGQWTGQWNLQWHVFEIVQGEIIRIDTPPDTLVTVGGDAPPTAGAFNIRDYAVVRVDQDGNAEWAILKGPLVRSERIETDAERREVREAALARDAALKKVDWNRRSDVHRQPAMTYRESDGCALIQVYGWTANRDEAIVVRANTQELGVSTSATFDLSRSSANISIETYVYDAAQRRFDFCSDIRMPPMADSIGPEVWRAVAGTVSIELSTPGVRAARPSDRRATVTLTNVVLRNAAGTVVKVPGPIKLSAIVGWFAG
jgi:hypothetical protein